MVTLLLLLDRRFFFYLRHFVHPQQWPFLINRIWRYSNSLYLWYTREGVGYSGMRQSEEPTLLSKIANWPFSFSWNATEGLLLK